MTQILDYASWIRGLSYEDVKDIYDRRGLHRDEAFEQAYAAQFDGAPDETLNENHLLVIVASQLDPQHGADRLVVGGAVVAVAGLPVLGHGLVVDRLDGHVGADGADEPLQGGAGRCPRCGLEGRGR